MNRTSNALILRGLGQPRGTLLDASWVPARYNPVRATTRAKIMLILGLDPGSLHTGFGLVERQGSRLLAVDHGRFSCPKALAVPARLAALCAHLDHLLDRASPLLVAVETPFFGVNARSLVMLAQARGALLARLAARGLNIVEYSPAEIKSTVTGNGRADKTQVARMVGLLLGFTTTKLSPDATDALAVAITAAQRFRFEQRIARGGS